MEEGGRKKVVVKARDPSQLLNSQQRDPEMIAKEKKHQHRPLGK
jgi:hypothetical protein